MMIQIYMDDDLSLTLIPLYAQQYILHRRMYQYFKRYNINNQQKES